LEKLYAMNPAFSNKIPVFNRKIFEMIRLKN
jgi:hypothetical protein